MVSIPPTPNLRVMVDANLLIAGTGWPRFPYEVLQHAVYGDYQLVLSPSVIDDARKYIAVVSPTRLEAFESFLISSYYEAVPDPTLEEVEQHIDLIRDPRDVPIALAAINAHLDLFITRDRDFTDQDKTTEEIRKRLAIILPGTFLREYMGWTSEALEIIEKRTWDDMK